MATIKIDLGRGVEVFPFPENITYREMQVVKKITGLRAGELYPALEAGDTDVVLAFAYTAVNRERPVTQDEMLDLPINGIEVDFEGPEANGGPPAEAAEAAVDEAAQLPETT